jgi:hypothetical protein
VRSREQGETVQLSKVRILERTRAKLEQEAQSQHTTLNAVLRDWLQRQEEETNAFGGPRVVALFRYLASLIGNRDETWLDDPNVFNVVRDAWDRHLNDIKPQRSPADQAEIEKEFDELRLAIEEASPARKPGLRRHAKFVADNGNTLDPEWRARYASLAKESEDDGV